MNFILRILMKIEHQKKLQKVLNVLIALLKNYQEQDMELLLTKN